VVQRDLLRLPGTERFLAGLGVPRALARACPAAAPDATRTGVLTRAPRAPRPACRAGDRRFLMLMFR